MLGIHGTEYANYAVSESDMLIAVGARFDDRVTGKLSHFATNAKIIHIDIDPGRFHQCSRKSCHDEKVCQRAGYLQL